MWYPTVTEASQMILPEEKETEQQVDSVVDPTVPVDAENTGLNPGSEYWLP
jgi:hypothetical protein